MPQAADHVDSERQAVLLLSAAPVMLVWILALFSFNPVNLFDGVQKKYGPGFLSPGNYLKHPLDQVSLGLSFALGTAGLPHVMVRF